MLSVVKMVNIDEIFKAISPTREEFSKELAKQRKILSQRISKAQTISTLATIQSEESRSNGVGSAINEGLSYASSSSSNVQSARSFSSVTKAQEIEDQKVAGNSFDEVINCNLCNTLIICCLVSYFGHKSKIGHFGCSC